MNIQRTPILIEQIKQSIITQRKYGYDSFADHNQRWIDTGEGVPMHGIPVIAYLKKEETTE